VISVTNLRLTDLSIRQLPFASGQQRYFDVATPNFGVTVGARTKSFFVVVGANRKLHSIGKYPDISLSDARKEAKRLMVQPPQEKPSIRLGDAVDRYLKDCATRMRPGTLIEYRRHLLKHPDVPLAKLTKHNVEVANAHQTIAWKVFANWCIRNDLLEKNPFLYLPVVYGKRSRVLTDGEVATIMRYDDGRFSDILKLCLLTGQRRTEVASIKQAWLTGDTLTIPAHVAKNRKEHTIAFNLLTALHLPKADAPPFNGFSKCKARFDKLHPFPHWTIHDLRRTFATIHARIGTPIHVVEAMLNHTSGTVSGVAAIYIRHNFLAEMRKAALHYEVYLAALQGGV
jgi:integrase